MEIALLDLYLGSVVYIVGAILFLLISKPTICNPYLLALADLFHLCVSFVVSLYIWYHWPFECDVMYGIVLLPALISETMLLILSYVVFYRKQ